MEKKNIRTLASAIAATSCSTAGMLGAAGAYSTWEAGNESEFL